MTRQYIARRDAADNPKNLSLPNGEALLTPREAAALAGVCLHTFHQRIKPQLPAVMVGGRKRYRRSDMLRLLGFEQEGAQL